MKVISLGMGQKIFENDSAVRQRQIEYGKFFGELHLVVFTPDDNKFENQKISENVFLYPTKSKSRVLYIFDFLRIIRGILKNSDRKDFVLTCQDPFEIGIVGTFVKLFYGVPLHIQIHTDLGHKYFRESSFLNKIRFLISEFILEYSDRVRVVSERIKKSIKAFSKNIDVLPIKMEIFQGSALEIKKPFPFTIVMACRLEKEKNIETVLRAIKDLENKNIGLCLVGDGSERNHLENMAQNMDIPEQIYFAGWQNDLAPYYKMADAFVSASYYEGYGVSTVEAGYYGLPLILSDTGIAGDVFKKASAGGNNCGAFICDAKDSNCFSQSISKIYNDKNLAQKMGESAKEEARRHLANLEDYFKKYADSVIKTADNFKRKNWFVRVFEFKKTLFNSIMLLRYFICGITSAGINILSLYLFTDTFGIWYLYSSVIAFIISLTVSFTLQKFVVFKDTDTQKLHYQFSKFFVAAVLGVLTNTIFVYLCTDVLGIWYILSQLIAGFFVMIQNFLLYKYLIFNKHK